MVKRNSAGQDYTNNADGFTLGGGSTQRNLSLTGADVTLTGSGSNTYNFPSSSDTLVGRNSIDTLKNKDLTDPSNTLPAATSAAKLDTARSLQVNLASASAQTFDGSANATNIGVSGTLPVGRGGTGATSFTSGNYLVGSGTGAVSSVASIPVTDIGTGVVKGSNNGTATTLTLWKGTLAQYNALGSYDSNTVYVIT